VFQNDFDGFIKINTRKVRNGFGSDFLPMSVTITRENHNRSHPKILSGLDVGYFIPNKKRLRRDEMEMLGGLPKKTGFGFSAVAAGCFSMNTIIDRGNFPAAASYFIQHLPRDFIKIVF